MRFFLVVTIWLVLVGGLILYTEERNRREVPQAAEPAVQGAPKEDFTLEITPTFSPARDPYTLQGEADAAATVVVRLGGREIFRTEKELPAGVPRTVHPVPGLVRGLNEMYLRAAPPVGAGGTAHAVRVRLLHGSRVVLDRTLWGEDGAVVAGSIPFTLEQAAEHRHGR